MRTFPVFLIAVSAALACGTSQAPVTPDTAAARAASRSQAASDTVIPDGPLGVSIRRGLALLEHTPDSLPQYAGGNLRCTSCHLDRGMRPNAAPLAGVHARFPKFLDRSSAVVPIEDRVNYCFTRSLAGRALPARSREMIDIMAYLAFISRGAASSGHVKGEGMPRMVVLPGDSARGGEIFAANCTRCHGADGAGMATVPAVWGPKSFSIGASMARVERAASFVRHNMPFDKPGTLTDQQAFDVATYIDSHARPDSPGKENDWPSGGAPADVPYATKGHVPPKAVPTLPRRFTDGAIVPVPTSAAGRSER